MNWTWQFLQSTGRCGILTTIVGHLAGVTQHHPPLTSVHQKSNFWSEFERGLILCGQDLYQLIESEKNNFRPKTAHLEGIEIDALEFFG